MKRSCVTFRYDLSAGPQALAVAAQPQLGWTMMVAITLAVMVFGMVWYG